MRIFFDNCTSPVLADILDALVRADGDRAFHIRSMIEFGLSAASSDVDWIRTLSEDNHDWIAITADDRIHRSKAERAAWRSTGLRGFVLAKGFQKTALNQTASLLIWRWPEMRRFIQSSAKGSMFELPVVRASGFKPLVA